MTSDGISTEDWDRVHQFAVEVVNAEDEADDERVRSQLIAYLDDLAVKYGELPSIYATKADYVDQPGDSERLLLRAFDLAISRNDNANVRLISFSLADLYSRDLPDVAAASHWADIARGHADPDDDSDTAELEQIATAIANLQQRESGG